MSNVSKESKRVEMQRLIQLMKSKFVPVSSQKHNFVMTDDIYKNFQTAKSAESRALMSKILTLANELDN